MSRRTKLAQGIWADAYGISVVYQRNGHQVERRFARGTSLDRLLRWRARQVQQDRDLNPQARRPTLTRDVVRYLKRLKGTAGYKAEKSHLRAWLARFGDMPRSAVASEQAALLIADWRAAGYAARTIRHRVRALQTLYRTLDGPEAITPVDDLALPPKPRPRPVSVSDHTIAAVARNLRLQELTGKLRDARTRARFLVLATTGRRPVELQRARPNDLDLEQGYWITRTAKGGPHSELLLNAEQRAAWRLFVQAGAWGHYDVRSFARRVRHAGWPKGIRPYNLRHSVAGALRRRGADAADVQAQLGHASITTAREFYFDTPPERQRAIAARLDARFGPDVFQDFQKADFQNQTRQDAKGREKTRQTSGIAQTVRRRRTAHATPRSTKSA